MIQRRSTPPCLSTTWTACRCSRRTVAPGLRTEAQSHQTQAIAQDRALSPQRDKDVTFVLDAAPRALRRDAAGDWHIAGKRGAIYPDGKGPQRRQGCEGLSGVTPIIDFMSFVIRSIAVMACRSSIEVTTCGDSAGFSVVTTQGWM